MGLYSNNSPDIDFSILTEVYLGRTDGIMRLQEQFSKFRDQALANKPRFNYDITLNSNKELFKFNRMVESFFGFYPFCMVIHQANVMNAFTYPISFRVPTEKIKSYIERTSDGPRYKKEAGCSTMIMVTSGLIYNPDVTNEEIFAAILHEIGHNFTTVLSNTLFDTNKSIQTLKLFKSYNKNDFTRLVVKPQIDAAKQQKSSLINNLNTIISLIYDNLKDLYNVKYVLYAIPLLLIKRVFLYLPNKSNKLEYNSERVADSFATMYGYGKDLSSFLVKVHKKSFYVGFVKYIQEAPLIGNLANIVLAPIDILMYKADIHPEIGTRIVEQLDYLNNELTSNHIDKVMAKKIKADIAELKELIDDIDKMKLSPADKDVIKNMFIKTSIKNSKPIKNLNILDPSKEIDDAYDKITLVK